MTRILPKDIIVDFLHTKLEDPRHRLLEKIENLTPTMERTYSLNPTNGKVICIEEITTPNSNLKKWVDYYFDYQNQKIIFKEVQTEEIKVKYKQGKAWIYTDKPMVNLGETSFPRINILTSGGTSNKLGQYKAPNEYSNSYQIDLWVKKDLVYEFGDHKYSNDKLAELLGVNAMKIFERNEGDLHPLMYAPQIVTYLQDLEYNEEYQCFHKTFIVQINNIDIGELTW